MIVAKPFGYDSFLGKGVKKHGLQSLGKISLKPGVRLTQPDEADEAKGGKEKSGERKGQNDRENGVFLG